MKMNNLIKFCASCVLVFAAAAQAMANPSVSQKTQVPTTVSESFTPVTESPSRSLSDQTERKAAKSCFNSIKSEPMPLPGQTQRSSQNFSLEGVKKFRIRVYQNGKLNRRIRFNIKLDRRLSTDPFVGVNVGTGIYTYKGPTYPLYIASPNNAGQSRFKVKFCRL
jgi:hypothetical protein